jgi:hypothetical protein
MLKQAVLIVGPSFVKREAYLASQKDFRFTNNISRDTIFVPAEFFSILLLR